MEPEKALFQQRPRLRREFETLRAMTRLYCRARHGGDGKALCPECARFLEYAARRLDRCPFQENKPACAKCPIHCYSGEMREQARKIMREVGPRMPWRHPIRALRHFLDELRPVPKVGARPAPRRSKTESSESANSSS